MIWEHRVGVVIVLGSVEGEEEFWPKKGQYQFHPVVVGGEWSNDALYVSNEKVQLFPNVEGFEEVAMVIHSYEDNETERLTLLHYPHWPVNGESINNECNVCLYIIIQESHKVLKLWLISSIEVCPFGLTWLSVQ